MKKLNDPVCKYCPNLCRLIDVHVSDTVIIAVNVPCDRPCNPVQWINGRVQRIEPLASPARQNVLPQDDYKQSLAELREDKEMRDIERLERIRAIKDMRCRGVFAMALADIPQTKAAALLNISQPHISRILRGE
jgi:predicted XRE-type DNA-binding protein